MLKTKQIHGTMRHHTPFLSLDPAHCAPPRCAQRAAPAGLRDGDALCCALAFLALGSCYTLYLGAARFKLITMNMPTCAARARVSPTPARHIYRV